MNWLMYSNFPIKINLNMEFLRKYHSHGKKWLPLDKLNVPISILAYISALYKFIQPTIA